jgi:hypothetical protein
MPWTPLLYHADGWLGRWWSKTLLFLKASLWVKKRVFEWQATREQGNKHSNLEIDVPYLQYARLRGGQNRSASPPHLHGQAIRTTVTETG